MARPSAPWWWDARECWACTIGERRHQAPRDIGKQDRLAAHEWHARLVEEHRPGAIPAGVLKVSDLCRLYLRWDLDRVEEDDRSERAHDTVATMLGKFCMTTYKGKKIGDRYASQFTASVLDGAIKAWRSQGCHQGYQVALVAAVKAVWGWASRPISDRTPERLLRENVLAGFQGPQVPTPARRYASREEAARWLRWLRTRKVHRSFILIQRALIHSGARPSELVRAQWKHVNWEGWRTDTGGTGAIITLDEWKNKKKTGKTREVFLVPTIRDALLRGVRDLPVDPERHLFTHRWGKPWSCSQSVANQVKRLRRAAIQAGIIFADSGPEKLVNYRWRHTAASTLLMNGVDVPTVAKLLGTSPEQILRTYGHLLTDHLAKAASKLSRRRVTDASRP